MVPSRAGPRCWRGRRWALPGDGGRRMLAEEGNAWQSTGQVLTLVSMGSSTRVTAAATVVPSEHGTGFH